MFNYKSGTPVDFGAHQRMNGAGVVHAANTMWAGPLKLLVTASSRSDLRSTIVRLSFPSSIDVLLQFQFLNKLVQRIKACAPKLTIPIDPCRLCLQLALAEFAGSYTANFLRSDEPRLLQDANVLLHACEGHVEFCGELSDRRI